jgi:hypothetical protein
MLTTLDIDDDVLSAAKELAASQNTTVGQVISDLVRQALVGGRRAEKARYRNGLRLMPRTERAVTPETIELLREQEL